MTLTPADLLSVWERGYAQRPPARAVTLLTAALPETHPDELLALPVGRRDERLLAFREATFGRTFTGVTTCRECGEQIELQFTSDDVRAAVPAPDEPDGPLSVSTTDGILDVRLPGSLDLLAIAEAPAGDPEALLLARCSGRESLDAETAAAVAARIESADPLAVIRLTIGCPTCGASFPRLFDIVTFLWSELDTWAVRIAREVHLLASAYGWSEPDILAMSTWRRQMYVELVQ